jgi:hypothetical protein
MKNGLIILLVVGAIILIVGYYVYQSIQQTSDIAGGIASATGAASDDVGAVFATELGGTPGGTLDSFLSSATNMLTFGLVGTASSGQ